MDKEEEAKRDETTEEEEVMATGLGVVTTRK